MYTFEHFIIIDIVIASERIWVVILNSFKFRSLCEWHFTFKHITIPQHESMSHYKWTLANIYLMLKKSLSIHDIIFCKLFFSVPYFYMICSNLHKIRWIEAGKSLVIQQTIRKIWLNSPILPLQVINSIHKTFYQRLQTYFRVLLIQLLGVCSATELVFRKARKSYLIQGAISSNSTHNHLLVRKYNFL